MPFVSIRPAVTNSDMTAVKQLCRDYRSFLESYSDELNKATAFAYPAGDFEQLLEDLAEKHARPTGTILIAESLGRVIGCGMSHALNDQDTEFKRVFIRPEARSSGAGKAISEALIEQARNDGFSRVLLDTSRQFHGAQKLYESLGFQRRNRYSDLPTGFEEYLVFYELRL